MYNYDGSDLDGANLDGMDTLIFADAVDDIALHYTNTLDWDSVAGDFYWAVDDWVKSN